MASEKGYDTSTSPSLCANGCGFFGNPMTRDLCSKCYRDFIKEQAIAAAASLLLTKEDLADPTDPSSASAAASTSSSTTESAKAEEIKKQRCGQCNKKVGIAKGFKCRCGITYCASHRFPSDHACTFDFKADGREKLEKELVRVKGEKLNRI